MRAVLNSCLAHVHLGGVDKKGNVSRGLYFSFRPMNLVYTVFEVNLVPKKKPNNCSAKNHHLRMLAIHYASINADITFAGCMHFIIMSSTVSRRTNQSCNIFFFNFPNISNDNKFPSNSDIKIVLQYAYLFHP